MTALAPPPAALAAALTAAAAAPRRDVATHVQELLEAGQRYEFSGAPARALQLYRGAAALADTPALRAEAVRRVGDAHRARAAWDEARAAYAESLAIARAEGLADLTAEAMNADGVVAVLRGDVERAAEIFREALAGEPGPRVRGLLLQNLGMCAVRRGAHAEAVALFTESLACFRESGYRRGVLIALNNVGAASIEVGDLDAASAPLCEAARIARDLMDLDLLLLTVRNEAELAAKRGRIAEAEHLIGEALGHFGGSGNERRRAECLVILGDIQRAYGEPARTSVAARCYERAVATAEPVGAVEVAARARAALEALGTA